jgi:hypothetical protein
MHLPRSKQSCSESTDRTAGIKLLISIFCMLASTLLSSCSSVASSMRFQQAEGVVARLDENRSALNHTAAGAYSYTAEAPTLGNVDLSVAGVTDPADQAAILQVLSGHRFEKERDWNRIRVYFYEKATPDPAAPQGVRYINLLRTETLS